eukprot:365222-Chlamydomonas_euryale.AAC.16
MHCNRRRADGCSGRLRWRSRSQPGRPVRSLSCRYTLVVVSIRGCLCQAPHGLRRYSTRFRFAEVGFAAIGLGSRPGLRLGLRLLVAR